MVCTDHVCNFTKYAFIDSLTFITAPSGPPTNFQVTADTTRSLVLTWEPPFPQHQNGILRHYIVTIALNNTTQVNNFSTTANTLRVTALIKPFRTYLCSVVAVTIALGPATEDVAVRTSEDSEYFTFNRIVVWSSRL